jgi:hypothetical protein
MTCKIAEYSFTITVGDDVTKKFRYKANDVAVDITGYVIEIESLVPELNQTALITDAAAGEFEFVFPKEDTALVTARRVAYEVVFYPTGLAGDKETKFEGTIHMRQEVA